MKAHTIINLRNKSRKDQLDKASAHIVLAVVIFIECRDYEAAQTLLQILKGIRSRIEQ